MKMAHLTADQLMEALIQVQDEGHDLRKIVINYRQDENSLVYACACIEEDLFDEQTNSHLRSLVIMSKPTEL